MSILQRRGLEKSNFIENPPDNFDCVICFQVARNPLECIQCGQTYCSECVNEWKQESGVFSCLKCEGTTIQSLQGILMECYQNLKYRCNCTQIVNLKEISMHQEMCQQPNCKYYTYCGQKISLQTIFKNQMLCGTKCQLFELAQHYPIDQKLLYKQIISILQRKAGPYNFSKIMMQKERNDEQSQQLYTGQMVNMIPSFKQKLISPLAQKTQNLVTKGFKWDIRKDFKGEGIDISEDRMRVTLNESQYVFKSVVADTPFQMGQHYFEVKVNEMTENELKIGVITNNTFNKQTAFCDLESGFAFYTLGKLRNGSNASGSDYGEKFKNSGVCGVYLDMELGILAFSYNGKPLGQAFQNQQLTQAPIYASVALLHCAGFTLSSSLPLPSWANSL